MLSPLGTPIVEAPRFTRRQLLVRGALAGGAIIVAGTIIRVASLFDQAPAEGRKVLSEREVVILGAFVEAALPGDDEMPAADRGHMVKFIDDYLAQADHDIRLLFKSMLQVMEEHSLLSHFSRFSSRSIADRAKEIRAWEITPIYLKRAAFSSVKMVVGMAYFEQPNVSEAIGWYVGCAPPHLIHKSKERLIGGTS
jgi:hypothetical protein